MTRILLALIAVAGIALAAACDGGEDGDNGQPTAAGDTTTAPTMAGTTPEVGAPTVGPPPTVVGQPTVTASGLQIIDITVGTGDEVAEGATITFHYTGWLEDGSSFDSSVGGEPATYALSDLIPGWQEGIPGMKEGGKRRLIIPPELAYGAQGRTGIPPNATLTFDIEVLDTQ